MNDTDSLNNSVAVEDSPHKASNVGLPFRSVLVYASTIFIGAFLLFQVQLIISKYILPWFGGAPAVWTTCNLVFQVLLLAGYLYAHLLTSRMSLQVQVKTHLFLIGISFLMLAGLAFLWQSPITAGSGWKPLDASRPVWDIVILLCVSIGAPFFILATTSPLLQRWLSQSMGSSPYRLFALSNAGSLLGLLSYPFFIEPNVPLIRQAWIWSAGYVVYILLAALCAMFFWRVREHLTDPRDTPVPEPQQISDENQPSFGIHVLWLSLAACGCAMFLATTNMICQEIAVIPFLWVLPLSLYLITFIVCFDSSRWYTRGIFHPLYALTPLLFFLTKKSHVLPQVGGYCIAMVVVCMICHGELARLKPSNRYLTSFYLMVATGGAVGGIFVALIAPLIFPAFWEFQIALWACGALIMFVLFYDRNSWFHRGSFWPLLFLMAAAGVIIETCKVYIPSTPVTIYRIFAWGIWGLAAMPVLWIFFGYRLSPVRFRWTRAYAVVLLMLLGTTGVFQLRYQLQGSFSRFRSFFGAFRLEKNGSCLTLKHGTTTHGWQIQDGTWDKAAVGYYTTNTGIGVLLWNHPRLTQNGQGADLRVGVVGLGVGTMAAYGRTGDYFCFYEIDPAVRKMSLGDKPTFTYLKNSSADVQVVMGDARLSMEREAATGDLQKFDVIILDAFNSDSIPIHLMTREAMAIYLKHLRDQNSVVVFHISNRVLDLAPVLRGLAGEFNLSLVIADSFDQDTYSTWGLLSRSPTALKIEKLQRIAEQTVEGAPSVLWTDDNSNLFHVVKKDAWW
jgi:hypothetical protein